MHFSRSPFIALAVNAMIGIDRNPDPGFAFLSVQSSYHNISCVLIGDCAAGQPTCSPDPSGSATNCVTLSAAVSFFDHWLENTSRFDRFI